MEQDRSKITLSEAEEKALQAAQHLEEVIIKFNRQHPTRYAATPLERVNQKGLVFAAVRVLSRRYDFLGGPFNNDKARKVGI